MTISGPYGEFFINHSESEMLYVGGGAGMAPMRSHLYELFRTLKQEERSPSGMEDVPKESFSTWITLELWKKILKTLSFI